MREAPNDCERLLHEVNEKVNNKQKRKLFKTERTNVSLLYPTKHLYLLSVEHTSILMASKTS